MTPNAEIRAEYSLQPFHHSQARTRFRREHLDHFHSAQLRPQNMLDSDCVRYQFAFLGPGHTSRLGISALHERKRQSKNDADSN